MSWVTGGGRAQSRMAQTRTAQSRPDGARARQTMAEGIVAQLGEHRLCKPGVVGSSPIISTRRDERARDASHTVNAAHGVVAEVGSNVSGLTGQRALCRGALCRANGIQLRHAA